MAANPTDVCKVAGPQRAVRDAAILATGSSHATGRWPCEGARPATVSALDHFTFMRSQWNQYTIKLRCGRPSLGIVSMCSRILFCAKSHGHHPRRDDLKWMQSPAVALLFVPHSSHAAAHDVRLRRDLAFRQPMPKWRAAPPSGTPAGP
jgi:hypothetical protein